MLFTLLNIPQEQYLFTQFEADYCHWVFPVFDQPDLKAKWTLTAVVPSTWDVVSNEYIEPGTEERGQNGITVVNEIATLFG